MKNLIMTGVIALSSMFAFAGNGEKKIIESDFIKIENSIDDVQLLNDNEPTYIYSYVLWIGESDETDTGYTWGLPLTTPPICQTEAEMEAMRSSLKDTYQLFYPNQAVQVLASIDDECN